MWRVFFNLPVSEITCFIHKFRVTLKMRGRLLCAYTAVMSLTCLLPLLKLMPPKKIKSLAQWWVFCSVIQHSKESQIMGDNSLAFLYDTDSQISHWAAVTQPVFKWVQIMVWLLEELRQLLCENKVDFHAIKVKMKSKNHNVSWRKWPLFSHIVSR